MIKDYWVYQKRNVAEPFHHWTLYIVKEYKRKTYADTSLCITFYSEDIPNDAHTLSFVEWHCDSISGYVDMIASTLSEFTEVHADDMGQLYKSVSDILMD